MTQRSDTERYVIVDIRASWSRRPFITFWRPACAGYAYPLSWAGDYTEKKVIESGDYLTCRRYSSATGRASGRWERFAVLRKAAEAIAVQPGPGQTDGGAGPVVVNNKHNRDHLIRKRLRLPDAAMDAEGRG